MRDGFPQHRRGSTGIELLGPLRPEGPDVRSTSLVLWKLGESNLPRRPDEPPGFIHGVVWVAVVFEREAACSVPPERRNATRGAAQPRARRSESAVALAGWRSIGTRMWRR